eukprot:5862217-Pleurochrysis_carterae.AAC.1
MPSAPTPSTVQNLSKRIGLQKGCVTVPSVQFTGNKDKLGAERRWGDRVKQHVSSVVKGRCDGADAARL